MLQQRYKILLNYLVGPLLFLILSYSIYRKISLQPNIKEAWHSVVHTFQAEKKWLPFCMLFLMLANWSLETLKWKYLVKKIEPVSFFTAVKSVLSGLSFSLFLPNGFGDYIGRMLYLHEGKRLQSLSVTFVGSIAQLIITLLIGTLGLVYFRYQILPFTTPLEGLSVFWFNGLLYALIAALICFLIIYFKISWLTKWFEKIPFVYKHRIFIQSLEKFKWNELFFILLLSFIRYSIFIVQYLLMLYLFHVDIVWLNALVITTVLFIVMAIVPTIPIADIGIRGSVCIQLFGLLSSNTVGIALTAASIWFINLIIPSLAGSLFVISVRLFRNNSK